MNDLDLREVILYLSRVEPHSNTRLMLQLALASDVPDETLAVLETKISAGASLVDLLRDDELLLTLLEADGEIGTPEENMLYETVEQIGIAVPANRSGAHYLLRDLTARIVEEVSVGSGD